MPFNNQYVLKRSALMLALSSLVISYAALADKYLDNAIEYMEKNETSSAIIELKNSIQNSPNDAQPRFFLGSIYLQQGSFLAAEKELTKALELGIANEEIAPLLLRTKLNLGKNQEVINYIDNHRVSDPYLNSELLALKAMAELNLNQVDAAKQSLQLAGDIALDSQYVKLSLARLDAAQKNIDQALKTIDELLDKDDSNADAWIFKGHLQMVRKDFAAAAESYSKAFQLAPSAGQYTLFISRALVMSGQMDKAQPYVDNVLNQYPNQVLANDLKAAIDFSNNQFEPAKQHADRAINNGSTSLATSLISGVSAYKLKLYEQANHRLRQIQPRLPDDHLARRLYIVTQLKLGYIDEAIEELGKLNTDSKQNSAFLSQTSMELANLGRNEEALMLAKKAYVSDNSDFNEMMLGIVKLSANDASGIDELKHAVAEQPDKRKAELGIGYYYLQLGAFDEAQNIADNWLKKNNKDTDALVLKGAVSQSQQHVEQAKKLYNQALTINPNHIQANILYAQILSAEEQWENAFQYAYRAKTLAPGNESATNLLYVCSTKAGKTEELLSLINKQLAQNPSDLTLIPQKAMALVLNEQNSQAINLLESLPKQNQTPQTWSLLGNIYFTQQRWIDAERAYLAWLNIAPADVNAHIRSIYISKLSNKYGSGIALADEAINVFPNDIRFPMLKTELLLESGKPEAAQQVLNTLDTNAHNLPYILKLQGTVYIQEQLWDKAISTFQQRYKAAPGVDTAKELATLYVKNHQASKAVNFLSATIQQEPQKARALQLLLADIQSVVDPKAATQQYIEIIAREPKNVMALNNISWLYIQQNNLHEACKYSARAYQLAGSQPAIQDTHGYCLLQAGETKQAVSMLEQAYQAVKTQPEIALHYVEGLIAEKQFAEAKRVLNNIDTNNPKFVADKKTLEIKLTRL
ncbi:MAG: XrtA/PEP-CTERM system TPR-repeat protein PrsT [Vibrio sp.]|uniref:XrtA/PEP-CTERM system TPR-repeat protein PrsT n=1 Tax=Vibrio sp. TaxID=678 RepID=UPI003A850692